MRACQTPGSLPGCHYHPKYHRACCIRWPEWQSSLLGSLNLSWSLLLSWAYSKLAAFWITWDMGWGDTPEGRTCCLQSPKKLARHHAYLVAGDTRYNSSFALGFISHFLTCKHLISKSRVVLTSCPIDPISIMSSGKDHSDSSWKRKMIKLFK